MPAAPCLTNWHDLPCSIFDEGVMPKNIVICCDGTGNEINTTISNVLKLYRMLDKDSEQHVYYHPGVGTIGLQSTWGRIKQEANAILSLATGKGLDEDTLAAYRFLCKT